MECKHDIFHLMGTANGIVCRGCGKLFASFEEIEVDRKEEYAPEITPEEPTEPAPAEAPAEEKKAPAKKTASKKAKKEE